MSGLLDIKVSGIYHMNTELLVFYIIFQIETFKLVEQVLVFIGISEKKMK